MERIAIVGCGGSGKSCFARVLGARLGITPVHWVSQGNQVLTQLEADLQQAEAAAGLAGWRDWLLGMRNTYVHRGRRSVTWSGNLQGNQVVDFNLRLPIARPRPRSTE